MPVGLPDSNVASDILSEGLAQSVKYSSWRLIPYTDGRYAFYPVGRLWKGFVLSPDQASKLFNRLDSIEMRVLTAVFIIVFSSLSAILFLTESTITREGWFWGLLLSPMFLVIPVGPLYGTRRILGPVSNLQPCQHPYPSDYALLKKLIIRLFLFWPAIFVGVFSVLSGVLLLFLSFQFSTNGIFDGLPISVTLAIALSMFAGAGLYFRTAYLQRRFRKTYGRRPTKDDLTPIDPVSGKMERRSIEDIGL